MGRLSHIIRVGPQVKHKLHDKKEAEGDLTLDRGEEGTVITEAEFGVMWP